MTLLVAPSRRVVSPAMLVLMLAVVVLGAGVAGRVAEVAVPPQPLPAISMAGWQTLADYHASIGAEMEAQGVEIDTSNPHAWVNHGLTDVGIVRSAMITKAAEDRTWWNRPPCKDGRYRYILELSDGRFALWVLEPVAGRLREVTAFITADKGYLRGVRDSCGDGDWWGHVYAG